MKKEESGEIKKLWQNQADEWLLKALCQDSSEYSEEVILIIKEIAEERNLIQKGWKFKDGNVPFPALGEKGIEIKREHDKKKNNRKASTIFRRLLLSIPIVLVWAILCAILNVNDRVGAAMGIPMFGALCAVWGIRNPLDSSQDEKRKK